MWIVRASAETTVHHRRARYLNFLFGTLAIVRTPHGHFSEHQLIPVVSIIWNYNGLVPQEMADRIVSITERSLTTTVDNIARTLNRNRFMASQ